MYILLVAATAMEIQPTVDYLDQQDYTLRHNKLAVLETGVGSVFTAYKLTCAIHRQRPAFIMQAGIAGSFSQKMPPGEMFMIDQEIFGDLGVEQNGDFNDVFDLRFADPSAFPFTGGSLVNPHIGDWLKYHIPVAKGVTVNEITTSAVRINQLQQKYKAHIETMEGAAFHYVCLSEKIPFIQFRCVSNFVGERDKKNWKLHEAVQVLNHNLIKILEQFCAT